MSLVTYDYLKCQCGFDGKIRLLENDTPYSSDFWMNYSLIGFEMTGRYPDKNEKGKTIIEQMKPRWPNCGRIQTDENLIGYLAT